MGRVERVFDALPALLAGTLLTGGAVAGLAVTLSIVATGTFLFEGASGEGEMETVSPYFVAAGLAVAGTGTLLCAEIVAWGWLRRRERRRRGGPDEERRR